MNPERIHAMDSGQKRLQELGYKQELRRSLSTLASCAMCFSVISVMTGITTTYNTGLAYGGTVSIVYGWFVVCFFSMCVASSMAEICSAYPTSGGLYFWSHKLAGTKFGPFMAWMTGWFNLVGLWAGVTSLNFSLAQLLQVVILVGTGGGNGGGYYASKYVVIGIHGTILAIDGLVNHLSIKRLGWLVSFATVWNLLGVFVIIATLLSFSPELQSASSVFTHFNRADGSGIHSTVYLFLIGLLMSQYTLLGYDVCAHMSEEIKSSDMSGAVGIVSAVGSCVVLGFGLLLALMFTSVNAGHLLDTSNDAKGYAVAQIFYDAFQHRFGDGKWAVVCLLIPCVAIFLCGLMVVTSTSRMTYAFSRDGALPFSNVWHRLNAQEVPVNAVWLSVAVALLMSLPYLGSTVAFQAMASIATIPLSISYVLPVFLRVTAARKRFTPGPFSLGTPWGLIIGWLAVIWVMFISVLFSLPVSYPVKPDTLNYTPVALGALTLFTLVYWFSSAKYWFKGPLSNIDVEEQP